MFDVPMGLVLIPAILAPFIARLGEKTPWRMLVLFLLLSLASVLIVALSPFVRIFYFLFLLGATLVAAYAPLDGWWRSTLFGLTVLGVLGCVSSGDLFSFYIFLELSLLSSAILVHNRNPASTKAGLNYLMTSALGSILFLFGIALYYSSTGGLLAGGGPSLIAVALLLCGLALKSALFPFHAWAPVAYDESDPQTSALLSGLLSKLGFIGILKFLPLQTNILLVLGLATALYAAVVALREMNLKKILAYSSIGHMGYVAFALSFAAGAVPAVVHMFNHLIAAVLLFLAAGIFIAATGKRRIDELQGCCRNPLGVIFIIGLLAAAGIPPLSCFFSESMILKSAFDSGSVLAGFLMIAALLISACFYIKVVYFLAVKEPKDKIVAKVSNAQWAVLIALLLFVILAGIYPEPLVRAAETVVSTIR